MTQLHMAQNELQTDPAIRVFIGMILLCQAKICLANLGLIVPTTCKINLLLDVENILVYKIKLETTKHLPSSNHSQGNCTNNKVMKCSLQ